MSQELVVLSSKMRAACHSAGRTQAAMSPCRALIFDLDGTLLDTEPISGRAIQQITSALGKEYHFALNKRILGRPSAEWTRMVIDELELDGKIEPRDMALQWEANMKAMYGTLDEMPGATAFIRAMHERGIPMALATSSSKAAVAVKRQLHEEMFSYFKVIVCGDDDEVKRGKPAPDIFLTAGRRLLGDDFDPAECIVFEDSVLGVQAGKSAGMKAMALPDARYYPTKEEQERLFHAADERLGSLSEFDPTKYGL